MRHVLPRCILAFAIVGGFSGAASADPPPGPHYCEIAMGLSIDGRPATATPELIVKFGEQATATVSRDGGMSGWQFVVEADPPTIVHRASLMRIHVDLFEIVNGETVLRASPEFALAPGQRADLGTMFGDGDGRKAQLSLVANLRSDEDALSILGSVSDSPADEPE